MEHLDSRVEEKNAHSNAKRASNNSADRHTNPLMAYLPRHLNTIKGPSTFRQSGKQHAAHVRWGATRLSNLMTVSDGFVGTEGVIAWPKPQRRAGKNSRKSRKTTTTQKQLPLAPGFLPQPSIRNATPAPEQIASDGLQLQRSHDTLNFTSPVIPIQGNEQVAATNHYHHTMASLVNQLSGITAPSRHDSDSGSDSNSNASWSQENLDNEYDQDEN